MKNPLFAAVGVVFFAVSVFGQAAEPVSPPRKAPELAFMLPGQGEKLLSQFRGKVVALEFILTTCPHCQASSHILSAMQQKLGSEGFQALDLAINGLDENRSPVQADGLIQMFTQTYQAAFPVGWVKRESMNTFMGFSFIERTVVPQVILIDRKGFIHYQTPASEESDLRKPEVMQQKVDELLAIHDTASRRTTASKAIVKRSS